MDIDIKIQGWSFGIFLALAFMAALIVLGQEVSQPSANDVPMLLTPGRWTAMRLARKVRKETVALRRDAMQLGDLLQASPSPVAAMLLAQRLYAMHRDGTSASGPARHALITAAESNAQYAVGALSRDGAVADFNLALTRIAILEQGQAATMSSVSATVPRHHINLPYILSVSHIRFGDVSSHRAEVSP